ncbi:LAQU0S02e08240g1_1 [Lachancea quebecensis]|uniref:DNA-(apurinic or apyrimidinic site) endonuclease 2 n=1 Tax=Lachancea quebecensis TaxID=1654605 RepID=A0A0P1KR05_9SACH|nr:LAQU0S02e08240g1_1 [Lachancea quebecensis]
MSEIPNKEGHDVRFLTFNVNGIRTLFHYHPFSSMNSSLSHVFDYFQSDIITFQELKTDALSLTKWGKVNGFHSFISLPLKRKGYSGVGCWVRIPKPGDSLSSVIQVTKAEEGVTGYLQVRAGKSNTRYRDNRAIGIGGYEGLGIEDEADALNIDSEGRCVMVELICNMVIISTYCPANSSQTDEGEEIRIKFLKVLFRRIRNLQALGKKVVLMGDINVCRDLIDHAEALKEAHIFVTDLTKGTQVEQTYSASVKDFIFAPSRPARRLLNEMLTDSVLKPLAESGSLIDTTRCIQGRDRMKMYTVWNTLRNSRPVNFGSRIDYILLTASLEKDLKKADIWPRVMGSDHCPVFADIQLHNEAKLVTREPNSVPPFEARYRHNLNHRDILSMFSKPVKSNSKESTVLEQSSSRVQKNTSAQAQTRLRPTSTIHRSVNAHEGGAKSAKNAGSSSIKKPDSFFQMLNGMLDKPPMCKHNENAILRTSKTKNNPGKKFWACARPSGGENDKEASCSFFQWK